MRFTNAFDEFLSTTVNLPQGKLDDLNGSVEAVYEALRSDAQMPVAVLRKIRQGSWAHKTIINPRQGREFDADFILELEERPEWDQDPGQYRSAVLASLRRHPRYGAMDLTVKCRCVRLVYAGHYHLDIVPFVRRSSVGGFIVNNDANEWEPADPSGFTAWFDAKNAITDGNLRRAMRIIKYVRDGSDWTGTRSVLLMILFGHRVDQQRVLEDPGYYGDVATTLTHLLEDLDDYLWPQVDKPQMPDPAGSGADFDHRWTPETYARLRERIHGYAATARAALDEEDAQRSLALWQDLLGDKFEASTHRSPATTGPFGPVAPTSGRSGRAG